jgi:hypothetical protein
MTTSIDEARREVEQAFETARQWADATQERSMFEFERQLWTLLLALGRALVALFLARQVARPRAAVYEHAGCRYVLDGERATPIGTRFGKVTFTRPVGRPERHARGACDRPVDRELGLCAGFSLGVVVAIARLCGQMAFLSARDTFCQAHEWMPSPRAALRIVDAVGDHARPFLDQAPAPDDDGEVLCIQVDGRGAPMISEAEYRRRRQRRTNADGTHRHARRRRRRERPRKRRTKGKKSKNAKVAVVGVLYTLRRTPEGLEGPVNKRLYGTFDSHEALFVWLRREADKRGYGRKQSLFLADGCDHIWRLQQRYFPDAEPCLDWYHVVEKVWAAGECMYAEGSDELAAWVGEQAKKLRRGATRAVIDEIGRCFDATPKTGPGNKGKRQRLLKIYKHFIEHQHRMKYRDLRRRDLDIGSGAVEGAVRNLVGIRFDGPGMRWSRGRSERLLHLRCILLNGQWDDFVAYLAARDAIKLPAAPIPTRTHDAKAAA